MPAIPIILTAVSVATTVAATVEQKRASDSAANNAKTVAGYNAAVDREEAAQIDLDTQANIVAMRKDAASYMSRQTSAFVAAGVRADTGSALAVRAATAGQLEMKVQQRWADSQAKEQHLEASAQAGIAEGDYQANQDHMEGVAAVMGGAAKVAGTLYGAYSGGVFGKPGSNTSTALDSMGGGVSTQSGVGVDSAGEI